MFWGKENNKKTKLKDIHLYLLVVVPFSPGFLYITFSQSFIQWVKKATWKGSIIFKFIINYYPDYSYIVDCHHHHHYHQPIHPWLYGLLTSPTITTTTLYIFLHTKNQHMNICLTTFWTFKASGNFRMCEHQHSLRRFHTYTNDVHVTLKALALECQE